LFNVLESIYVHFAFPSKNQKLQEVQKEVGIKNKTMIHMLDRYTLGYADTKTMTQLLKILLIFYKYYTKRLKETQIEMTAKLLVINIISGQII